MTSPTLFNQGLHTADLCSGNAVLRHFHALNKCQPCLLRSRRLFGMNTCSVSCSRCSDERVNRGLLLCREMNAPPSPHNCEKIMKYNVINAIKTHHVDAGQFVQCVMQPRRRQQHLMSPTGCRRLRDARGEGPKKDEVEQSKPSKPHALELGRYAASDIMKVVGDWCSSTDSH